MIPDATQVPAASHWPNTRSCLSASILLTALAGFGAAWFATRHLTGSARLASLTACPVGGAVIGYGAWKVTRPQPQARPSSPPPPMTASAASQPNAAVMAAPPSVPLEQTAPDEMVLPVPADAAAKGLSIRHTVVTYADGQTQSVQIVRDGLRAPFRLLLGNAPELLARITTLEYQVFLDGIYIERHLSDISAQIRDHHPGQPKAIEMARFAIDRERAQYALPRWLAQASPSNLTAAGIEDLSVYGSAIYRAMGNRETQEDRAGARFVDLPLHEDTVRCQFTYVLDGHNGPGCAEHGIRTIAQLVQRRVLQFQAYEGTIALVNGLTLGTVDCSYSYAAPAGGTTFNGALRIGKTLLVANVGDCRSLLVYPDARFVQCSRDHEPMLCRREIEQRGGKIGRNPECELEVRVNRYLNFGRALGNNTVGRGALSARAEVTRNTIEGPAYLVQFTDGLSSFATNGDVAHYVAQHFREGAHAIAAGLCHSANQVALAHAKAANEDADNVTVVVTPYFMPWKQPLLSTPQKV